MGKGEGGGRGRSDEWMLRRVVDHGDCREVGGG